MPAYMDSPESLKIARLSVKAVSQMAQSVNPFTQQRQLLKWPGDHWEFGLTLPPMTRDEASEVLAFLLSAQDGLTFSWGPVGREATPRGTALGEPATYIPAGETSAVTAEGLHTDGWTPDQTGVLKAGDWIQFGDQLCRLTGQSNANAQGQAILYPWPAPRLPYPGENVAIVTSNPKGVFRLGTFTTEYDLSSAQHYGLGFTLVEVF